MNFYWHGLIINEQSGLVRPVEAVEVKSEIFFFLYFSFGFGPMKPSIVVVKSAEFLG